jgi:hypothetical protein
MKKSKPFRRWSLTSVSTALRTKPQPYPASLPVTTDHLCGLPQVFVGAVEFLGCMCSTVPQEPHQVCVFPKEDVPEAQVQRRNNSP